MFRRYFSISVVADAVGVAAVAVNLRFSRGIAADLGIVPQPWEPAARILSFGQFAQAWGCALTECEGEP